MSFVVPSFKQEELGCPTEADIARGVFLPDESSWGFNSDPIFIGEAINIMRADLNPMLERAAIYNRYSEEYYKVSEQLIDTITSIARACVSYLHIRPNQFALQNGWRNCELESCYANASFHFRKCHAAVEAAESVNEKIYLRMLALECKWFNLIQRLGVTMRWLDDKVAWMRSENLRRLEEAAKRVAQRKAEEENQPATEKQTESTESKEPAPFRAASPILPGRMLSASQPLLPTESAASQQTAPAKESADEPASAGEPAAQEKAMERTAEPIEIVKTDKAGLSENVLIALQSLEELRKYMTPLQYEKKRKEAMEVPPPEWCTPIEVEEL